LFLHLVRSRVKTRLVISTVTEHELRSYVPWAARHVMMAPDEILVRVVDRALDEYFKRDKLWRKDREAVLREAALSRWRSFGERSPGSAEPSVRPENSAGPLTEPEHPSPNGPALAEAITAGTGTTAAVQPPGPLPGSGRPAK
jgi:hypothetical protein